MRPILIRFGVSATLLLVATWIFIPNSLFRFPRENPGFWAAVMFGYPFLSVLGQEVVFFLLVPPGPSGSGTDTGGSGFDCGAGYEPPSRSSMPPKSTPLNGSSGAFFGSAAGCGGIDLDSTFLTGLG